MKTERNYQGSRYFTVMGIFVLIACLCFQTTAFAAGFSVGSTAYCIADTKLNLRAEPQGEIIGKLNRGKTVTILSKIDRNGYYHVRVNGTGLECYAYSEYLSLNAPYITPRPTKTPMKTPVSTPKPTYQVDLSEYEETDCVILIVVSDKKLNLRTGPSKRSPRIQYLKDGYHLDVLDNTVTNNYIKVKVIETGKIGYVDINYTEIFEICEYEELP